MAKAPAKRKSTTRGGSGALAKAKAQVAKLESAEKRKAAVTAATKAVATAKAQLAKAKKIK